MPKKKKENLKLSYVNVNNILDSEENPQEMDDATFDQLVEGMSEVGFDEPVHITPIFGKGMKPTGKYRMVSGHHRLKAARVIGMESVPCIVRSMTDEQRKIELVRRNNLHGSINPEKFTKLFTQIAKSGADKEALKLQMGFTKKEAFNKVYKDIAKTLTVEQKKQLEEAKEDIRTVDDLSSVLNTIFKSGGSDLESGFMVFSFGGKNHHYIIADAELDNLVTALENKCKAEGIDISDVMKELLSEYRESEVTKPRTVKRKKRFKKKNR